jgi:3-deoxy-D-manno-octulosonic-acid transferase
LGGQTLVLAASTHPGEDEIILSAWRTAGGGDLGGPLLVIAPRHPERGLAIAETARAMGFATNLQSAGDNLESAVFVADALGELGVWFRLARLAVMGGAFIDGVGGHNPLEPARLGAPFVSGLAVDNWRSAYQMLSEAGATALVGETALVGWFSRAVRGEPALGAMARRARSLIEPRDAAAREALGRIVDMVPQDGR